VKGLASRGLRTEFWLAGALLLGACGSDGPATTGPDRRAVEEATAGDLGGGAGGTGRQAVVARVGGARILAGEVVDLARATGLAPREALDRLIAEALLGREAERRGLGTRSEIAAEVRRASVRAWLAAEVERALPPSVVTDAEIAASYAAQSARFVRPEERIAIHVLLPLAADAGEARVEAARRLAERALEALRSEDPRAVLARFKEDPRALSGAFSVVAEEVPGLVRGGAFDPAFLDAVFSLPGPGLVPAPVRSSFGWHAIVVVALRPDATVPLAAARDALRAELIAVRRAARLEELASALAAKTPPRVDPRATARLAEIAADGAPGSPGGAP
jgi:peptidyl-prolyl cis-trans isomerase C